MNWKSVGKRPRRRWQAGTGKFTIFSSILSSAGHEKSCVKLAGPSAKAKYSPETDSEPVPWGKGEKHLEQRSETDPEPVRLQAVGAA